MQERKLLTAARGERYASLITGMPLIWPAVRIGIEEFLLRPRRLSLLFLGSALCAMLFCLSVFDLGFLTGTSPYWQAPRGLVGLSWADISQALTGYNYFAKDSWTLPLFQTSKLGIPNPVNIIFTDSIPIVAICGRLIYRATGVAPNLYGAWTALCFVGSALALTGLVVGLGQRGIAAAIFATVCALCMPALLQRWGHMSLMAQWEPVVALIIYFWSRSAQATTKILGASLLLAAVALWTHAYLFVMVMGILSAALAQAVVDRRIAILPATSIAALFMSILAGLALLSGYFSGSSSLAANGFGAFSMNLLSPIFPQLSGIFPAMRELLIDGTGGQYEGFSYFGAGVLFLGLMMLPDLRRATVGVWRAHPCIIAILVAFAVFAISNQIYLGPLRVINVPLPAAIFDIASMFRSSGRFFWPSLYLLTALAIVTAPALRGRTGVWLLLIATVIQFVDTGPLRSALATRTSAPVPNPLSETRWAAAIRQHDVVFVVPPYGCDAGHNAEQIAMEIGLLASRENVATNTVYANRNRVNNCAPPQTIAPAINELWVYVVPETPSIMPSDPAVQCAASRTLGVCSGQLDSRQLTALLEPNI